MSETPTPSTSAAAGSTDAPASTAVDQRPAPASPSPLHTEHGTTTIASSVVAKIASMATQEVPGVQAMGKTLTRTLGAIRSKVPGGTPATTQGVSVEVGERQAAIDVDIVVYYGESIVDTADAIRSNVIDRIEGMTGLQVVEVNIAVDDLYLGGDGDGDEDQASRVT